MDASVPTQKYRCMKRRLFPHGGVARRCLSQSYVASSRLALRKNPSVSFVPLFLCRDTKNERGVRVLGRFVRQAGFSLLEVLVALVIVVVGLLGVIGLQAVAQQSEFESYQRAQALIILNDVVEMINTNRDSAGCFGITGATTGTPYFGTTGAGYVGTINCTSGFYNEESRLLANAAMTSWDNALRGATETRGGTAVAALIGARGCVSVVPATNTYTVAVVWQGLTSTFDFTGTIPCAQGLYGDNKNRRVVWTTLRLGKLL